MKQKLFIALPLAATLAYGLLLVFQIPLLQSMPRWFWKFIDKPLVHLWLIVPLGFASFFLIDAAFKRPGLFPTLLPLVILLGFALQMSFALMEGRGVNALRERMISTGHAELIVLANAQDNMLHVARDYEGLIERGELGKYGATKPPGTALVYMFLQRCSNLVAPVASSEDRYWRLASFASFLYPLLTYLTVIPLFFFGRFFLTHENALQACLLYLFLPNVTLITLTLDQALYPLVFMSCLYGVALACHRGSVALSVLAGAASYAALYLSFSLQPVGAMALAIFGIHWARNRRGGENRWEAPGLLAGYAGGVVAALIAFRLTLDYDIFERYASAMHYHRDWKKWTPGPLSMTYYAGLNFIEYAVWVGIPVAALAMGDFWRSVRETRRQRFDSADLLACATLAVFFILGFFGRTIAEVARLWLFMAPLVCLFACRTLAETFPGSLRRALFALVAIQGVTTLLIKRYQDFW